MKNSIPYSFLGEVGVLALQELRRNQKADEVSKAIFRLKNSSGSLSVMPPKDLLTLIETLEFLEVLETVKELKETLEFVHIPQDAREIVESLYGQIENSLMHPGRPPEREDSEQTDREIDWFSDPLQRNPRPSFILISTPSPADALEGIDRGDAAPGTPSADPRPSTVISQGTRRDYNPDGSGSYTDTTQRTTVAPDGTVKTTSMTVDMYGFPEASSVTLREPSGRVTEVRQWTQPGVQIRTVTIDGRTETFMRSTIEHEPWRRIPNAEGGGGAHTGGRRGTHTGELVDNLPTGDEMRGNPQFILKLKDGRYAQCVFINPVTGMSSCTILGRDEVNIDPENTPVVDAPNLIIDEFDLVVNWGPYTNYLRSRTPTPLPREEHPGGRPPNPDDPV